MKNNSRGKVDVLCWKEKNNATRTFILQKVFWTETDNTPSGPWTSFETTRATRLLRLKIFDINWKFDESDRCVLYTMKRRLWSSFHPVLVEGVTDKRTIIRNGQVISSVKVGLKHE